ncbi:MAG: HDIG domain-containing protein [Chitinivibrionales bacterium]|nr:HDIG domain-containing protein [Chitinivibrionales bacterium]
MQEPSNTENKNAPSGRKYRRFFVRFYAGKGLFRRVFTSRIIVLLGLVGVLALLFPFTVIVPDVDIPKEGELAKETVVAPFTFDIIKPPDLLERQRHDAADAVMRIMDYDNQVLPEVRRKLLDLQRAMARFKTDAFDSLPKQIITQNSRILSPVTLQTLRRRPWLVSSATDLADRILQNGCAEAVLVSSPAALEELKRRYTVSFDNYRIYDKPQVVLRRDGRSTLIPVAVMPLVKEVALENTMSALKNNPSFDGDALAALYDVLNVFLMPNVLCNDNEFALRQQNARNTVLSIKGKVAKEAEIVRKNQVVTADVVEQLRSLKNSLLNAESVGGLTRIIAGNAGRFLLLLLALSFLVVYIVKDFPKVIADRRLCLALASIITLQFAIVRLGAFVAGRLFEGGGGETALYTAEFVIPATVAAMLVTLLFSERLSIGVAIFCAVGYGLMQGFSLALVLFGLFGGITAAIAIKNVRYRFDFFKVLAPILLVQGVFVALFHVAVSRFAPEEILRDWEYTLIGCVVSVILAVMATALFETLFDITTDMKLIELADMNHPVLKRLSIEAAGTYNHSVLVGNLAESAAKCVGANALYARVASYYHDIGKIPKADYFIENAVGDKKGHARLTPAMSALIISSHIKEGVALARKYRLPRTIHETILQHHGTGTVSVFYQKALKQNPLNPVKEDDFRYSGPMPQTRENAIIMLADCVEAASRSLGSSSPRMLRDLVKKIIEEKFMASQFEQCDLTLRDLDKIVQGFMPILQGMFHTRIGYSEK